LWRGVVFFYKTRARESGGARTGVRAREGSPGGPYRSEPQKRWIRRQASSSTAFDVA
jgi:hypothetical protein